VGDRCTPEGRYARAWAIFFQHGRWLKAEAADLAEDVEISRPCAVSLRFGEGFHDFERGRITASKLLAKRAQRRHGGKSFKQGPSCV